MFVAGVNKTLLEAWKIERLGRGSIMCGPDTTPFQLVISIRHLDLPRSTAVCRGAAKQEKLQCLVAAVSHGCDVDETVMESAALAGHIEMMQWLRVRACGVDHQKTCLAAVKSGNIDAVK